MSPSRSERLFNQLLGLSVLSWAFLGLGTDGFTLVRCCIASLHVTVALLVLGRAPALRQGSLRSTLESLPSLIVAGWAFRAAPSPHDWHMAPQLLFVAGTLFTIAAFSFLGRSFAILPALRGVVASGPYRFLRHPAYVGELCLVLACCLAAGRFAGIAPFLVAVPLVAMRIRAEERLLSTNDHYRDYAALVRWRLVPGFW